MPACGKTCDHDFALSRYLIKQIPSSRCIRYRTCSASMRFRVNSTYAFCKVALPSLWRKDSPSFLKTKNIPIYSDMFKINV